MTLLDRELAAYVDLKKRIQEEYAVDDDAQELLDTLEGETSLKELLSFMVRKARDDEARVEANKAIIGEIKARSERLAARADDLRTKVAYAMQAAGLKKIDAPDCTISFRTGNRRLVKTCDASEAPEAYRTAKTTYTWNNDALIDALETLKPGETLNFARFEDGQPFIQVRKG